MKPAKRWARLAALAGALVLAMALLMTSASAYEVYEAFEITNYDIQAQVGQDRTIDVTETLQVDFSSARHGLYRTIPLSGMGERVSIKHVYVVGAPYETSRENGVYTIQIGDADKTVIGPQTYVIHYTLVTRPESRAEEELYLNLIGTEWDTVVHHAKATVTFPAGAQTQRLAAYTGSLGSRDEDGVTVRETATGCIVETTRMLEMGEGVTLEMAFQPGGMAVPPSPTRVVYPLLAVALVGLAALLYLFKGREAPMVEPVSSTRPTASTPLKWGMSLMARCPARTPPA